MIKPTNKKAVSIFEQVAPDLKTNDNGEASYKVRKHFGLPRNIFKLIFPVQIDNPKAIRLSVCYFVYSYSPPKRLTLR